MFINQVNSSYLLKSFHIFFNRILFYNNLYTTPLVLYEKINFAFCVNLFASCSKGTVG